MLKCPVCEVLLLRLGATIGGTQLMGCPVCHVVYWKERE